ncbi:hypothetical protein F5I97DRAFT_420635 [Phlebopus sp. FC_14]|nr:hypothetical protein F5I97DRAFT_420635 [Phlebopus sp. FC_14]
MTTTNPASPSPTPGTYTPPPITQLLPLFQAVLRAAYSVFRFVFRATLVIATPLYTLWPLILAVLSPITILLQVLFEVLVFTPCSFLYTAATALHPLYIFLAIACFSGATIGLLGRYAVAVLLSHLASSKHSVKPPKHATFPATDQVERKRKRRSVRTQ